MIRAKILHPGDGNRRVLLDFARQLFDLGIDLNSDPPLDLAICHQTMIEETIAEGLSCVVIERVAGGHMTPEVKKYISNPAVLAVLRSAWKIDKSTYDVSHTSKLSLGWSLACRRQMNPFISSEKMILSTKRPIDVSFVGNTNLYQGQRSPTYHRQECVAAMKKLTKLSVTVIEDRISPHEYRKIMSESKVVVSPWGWGEVCFRDYEAVLLGCEVVKPDARHIEDASSLFPAKGLWRWCKPNFDDLAKVIEEAITTPILTEEKLTRRALVLEERKHLPAHLAETIIQALG